MASQTVEFPPVAYRAAGLVETQLAARVRVQKIGRMAGRFQVGALGVAEFATVRRIDLAVAHQAIGHLRHVGVGYMIRRIDSPMARQAGVRGIEITPNVVRIRQICLVVDRRCD